MKLNEFNNSPSFKEKIAKIKKDNPGKFEHLPNPKSIGALDSWSVEEANDFDKNLKSKFENSKDTERIQRI